MNLLLTSLTTLSLIATVTSTASADTYSCPNPKVQWIGGPAHGYNDSFSPLCKEPAHPSDGLKIAYNSNGPPFSDFDATVIDRFFIHTMKNFPGGGIVGATLTIRARPLSTSLNDNDTISLRFVNEVTGIPDTNFLWSRRFGTTGSTAGVLPNAWNQTNYPNGHLFTLDLCALPLDSASTNPNVVDDLIPYLDLYKHLDIVVQDDTAIDFVSLQLTHCCGGGVSVFPVLCAQPLDPQPQLWCSGCAIGGGTIDIGVEQGQPLNIAALFIGVGQGSVPVGNGATIDILPLIGGPILLPLDQEGEFRLQAALPPFVGGVSVNLQTLVVDPATNVVRSSNGVTLEIL